MDTNWCTYCDCAVSPFGNSIYCSEECFRRDAMIHNPVLVNYQKQIALQQQQQMNIAKLKGLYNNTNTTSQSDSYTNTRRDSNSSISSDCLAAMYFESMSPSSSSSSSSEKNTTPVTPCLSTSSSSSQSLTPGIDECYTSLFSFKEELCDKHEDSQFHPLETMDYSHFRI